MPGLGSPVVGVAVVSCNFVDAFSICMQCERVATPMMRGALSRGKTKADGHAKGGPRALGSGRSRAGRGAVEGA